MNISVVTARNILYDGRQLAPLWIYRNFDLLGDSAVALAGPCKVDLSEMVDVEDVKNEAPIYSPLMLHIICEFFSVDLHTTVCRQRLLIVKAKELIEEQTSSQIKRDGDDLYLWSGKGHRGKLSVSIATSSVTSTLIHTGFNIETEGTPVSTVGLREIGVSEPLKFGEQLLQAYKEELEDIWLARCKVRAVYGE